jgi:hypothetical protein
MHRRATQRLAVDGEVAHPHQARHVPEPGQAAALQGPQVQGGEDRLEGVVGRHAVGQLQEAAEPALTLAREQGHVGPVITVGDPAVGSCATYVYGVKCFGTPAFVLASGPYPRAVGFDPKNELVYGQNFDHQLILFSQAGAKQKEYQLAGGGQDAVQFAVHPEGGKLLVLTTGAIYYVELPK